MDVEDRELIERCRAGDDTAFGELVDRYKDLVFGLVYRMVADRSLAEDLAQDVFLKVHRGIPYFRGEARLSTWIFRIVQNVCVQARSRRPADEPLEGTPRPVRRSASSAARTGRLAPSRTRDRLDQGPVAAAQNYRMLVIAHYLRGVQDQALAEALNLPLGTVKTHLYRAKRRLRELLEE